MTEYISCTTEPSEQLAKVIQFPSRQPAIDEQYDHTSAMGMLDNEHLAFEFYLPIFESVRRDLAAGMIKTSGEPHFAEVLQFQPRGRDS